MHTRTGQKHNGHLLIMRQKFSSNFVSVFKQNCKYENLLRKMFVNMDKIAIHFETKPKRTIHPTGCNATEIRASGSSNHRLTA